MKTMVRMMMTVRQSKSSGVLPKRDRLGKTMSVMVDTNARQRRMAVKGLTNAPASRLGRDFFFSWVTLLLPYWARLAATASGSRPLRGAWSSWSRTLTGVRAAS